jgi:hypothetical protein
MFGSNAKKKIDAFEGETLSATFFESRTIFGELKLV